MLAKKKRGPPPTGKGQQIVVRMHPPQITELDAWVERQTDPKPTRAEAIRRLVEQALTSGREPNIEQRIAKTEQKLARKIPAKPSPERGVALMRKGLAEVEHRKLVAKKKKNVDTSGQMRAAEPDLESRPKQATGKKGGDVQAAKRTRSAPAAKVDPAKPRRRTK